MERSPGLNESTTDSQLADVLSELARVKKILEESKQEAYELRSRLQVSERVAHDFEGELEAIQQEAIEKEKIHEAALREIQEEKLLALKSAEEKHSNLESEYEIASNTVKELQKELRVKAEQDQLRKSSQDEHNLLQEELKEALDALSASTAACEQHKELISVLQNEKQSLMEHVTALEKEVESQKEYLSVSKAQLSDHAERLKEMQEQFALAQNELAALKSAPADVMARGNSLFAEVEDDRQKILKQHMAILGKYKYMKSSFSSKCEEIKRLKTEISRLQSKLETAEKTARKHYRAYVGNYEIRIQELQKAVNDLKDDVKPVYLNGDDEILKFAEKTVENSRREVNNLREEMEWRSALRLNEAADLLKTRGELNEVRSELRHAYIEVKELKEILEENGIANTRAVNNGAATEKIRSPPATISNLIDAVMVPLKQTEQRNEKLQKFASSVSVNQEVRQKSLCPENVDVCVTQVSSFVPEALQDKIKLEVPSQSSLDGNEKYTTLEEELASQILSDRKEMFVPLKVKLEHASDVEYSLVGWELNKRADQCNNLEKELVLHSAVEDQLSPQINQAEGNSKRKEDEGNRKVIASTDASLSLEEEIALHPAEEAQLSSQINQAEGNRKVIASTDVSLSLEELALHPAEEAQLSSQINQAEGNRKVIASTDVSLSLEEELAVHPAEEAQLSSQINQAEGNRKVITLTDVSLSLEEEFAFHPAEEAQLSSQINQAEGNRKVIASTDVSLSLEEELALHPAEGAQLSSQINQAEGNSKGKKDEGNTNIIALADVSLSLEEELALYPAEETQLSSQINQAEGNSKGKKDEGNRNKISLADVSLSLEEELVLGADLCFKKLNPDFFHTGSHSLSVKAGKGPFEETPEVSTLSLQRPVLNGDSLFKSDALTLTDKPNIDEVSSNKPDAPSKSILKNRNTDTLGGEAVSKEVSFHKTTIESGKENATEDFPEPESGAVKPRRKFKRPPPKTTYPIYYMTS